MKKLFCILFCIVCFISASGQHIDVQTAQKVAETFYAQCQTQKSVCSMHLYCSAPMKHLQKSADKANYYYIFNADHNGYVIVSGDQRCVPVLGYSTSGSFDTTNMPDNLRWWMRNYCNEMDSAFRQEDAAQMPVHAQWAELINGNYHIQKAATAVNPLLNTKWGQGPPYNDSCPYDVKSGSNYNYRCPTGCVATAMAQILYYWKFPVNGKGSHGYSHSTYGYLSANFGNTTYNWNSMTSTYTNNSTTASKNAVATLMYHCGVSVDMDYTPTSSGAVTLMTDAQVNYFGFCDARTALMRYFGCDTVIGLYREDYYDSTNTSTISKWTDLLKNELNEGRPILYAGTGSAGGHAFVCDGYDANGNFHINWGWGGTSDGYFVITALNPAALGTGGGSGGFNYNQRALFITAYADTTNYDLRLASALRVNKDTISTDSTIEITTKIVNSGKNNYSGTFGLALYTAAGELVEYIDETSQQTLNADSSFELSFSSLNTGKYQSGQYYAVVYYKASNRWKAVADGNYANRIQFFLMGNGNFKLDLYGALHISANPVTYNTPFRFTDSLANLGEETFNGLVAIAIYEATSNECLTIAGSCQISLGTYKYINLTFEIPAMPGMTNGKYYGVIVYSVNNGNTWNIVDGQMHTNRVNFTVTGGSELKLYSKLNISKSIVPENAPFQIHVNIANMGSGTFYGSYAMFIFNDRGDELIAPMEIKTNRQLASLYYDSVIFTTTGMKELEKGKTYNAVVYYQQKGDSMWNKVSDFKSYSNVVSFKVGEQKKHTLRVLSDNTAAGSVSGSCTFYNDTTVIISAMANSGYRFTRWSDGNMNSSRTVTVKSDTTFIAYFEATAAKTYQITVVSIDTAMGTVTGSGTFKENSQTTIMATAKKGFRFVQWQDGNSQRIRTITVTENATYTAFFDEADGVAEVNQNGVHVFSSGNEIVVQNAEHSLLRIYNTLGQIVFSEGNVSSSEFRVCMPVAGVYYVTVGDGKVKKCVIRK